MDPDTSWMATIRPDTGEEEDDSWQATVQTDPAIERLARQTDAAMAAVSAEPPTPPPASPVAALQARHTAPSRINGSAARAIHSQHEPEVGFGEAMTHAYNDWLESDGAALVGATDAATFGFADELGAAIRSATGDETYDQAHAATQANLDRIHEESPAAFELGGLAGMVATAPLLPASGGVGAGGRVVRATGIGTGVGGLSGLGHSRADSVSGAAVDTLLGAGAGAGAGFLSQTLVEGATPENWDRLAGRARIRQVNGTPGDTTRIDNTYRSTSGTGLGAFNRDLRESGTFSSILDDSEAIRASAQARRQAHGRGMEADLARGGQSGETVSHENIMRQTENEVLARPRRQAALLGDDMDSVQNAAVDRVERDMLARPGQAHSIPDTQEYLSSYYKNIDYDHMTPTDELRAGYARVVRTNLDDALDRAGARLGQDVRGSLQAHRRGYGANREMEGMAGRAIGRPLARPGLLDTIAYYGSGGGLRGLAAAGGVRVARAATPGLMANHANTMADLFRGGEAVMSSLSPEVRQLVSSVGARTRATLLRAAERGERALMSSDHILQRSDPVYRRAREAIMRAREEAAQNPSDAQP